MSGERIDYSIERQRHEGTVGLEALLDQIDEILTVEGVDKTIALASSGH